MEIRRLVVAKDASGRSAVVSDGPSPRAVQYRHIPGAATAPLWATGPLQGAGADPVQSLETLIPGPGATQFLVVTFAPDSVMRSPAFDPVLARRERAANAPGLAETFEDDNPGMHTTPTVDYGVVMDGEICLDLGDGQIVPLNKNDTFVLGGVRHAWRNPTDTPSTVAFVLLGAPTQQASVD